MYAQGFALPSSAHGRLATTIQGSRQPQVANRHNAADSSRPKLLRPSRPLDNDDSTFLFGSTSACSKGALAFAVGLWGGCSAARTSTSRKRVSRLGDAKKESTTSQPATTRQELNVVAVVASSLLALLVVFMPAPADAKKVPQIAPEIRFQKEKVLAPPDIAEKSSARALNIGTELKKRKAQLFGAYWCGYCDKERQELGSDVFEKGLVEYVECDAEGVNGRPQVCADAGVSSYPSWRIVDKDGPIVKTGARGLFGLERLMRIPSPEDANLVAPPIKTKSTAKQIEVADQLSKKGAEMYCTFGDERCDAQRQLLGAEAWKKVPYVECDWRVLDSEPDKCNVAQVKSNALPDWKFGDVRVADVLTIEQIEKFVANIGIPGASPDTSSPTIIPPPPSGGLPDGYGSAVDKKGRTYYWKKVDPFNTRTWTLPQVQLPTGVGENCDDCQLGKKMAQDE